MPDPDPRPDHAALAAFVKIAGRDCWGKRVVAISERAKQGQFTGRATQQRHAAELMLARLSDPKVLARAGASERRVLAFAREVARLDATLGGESRARLRAMVREGLTGEATLIPVFHLVRTAALARARGFAVRFDGLLDGAAHDLLITREGASAEVALCTVSAEEGRPMHRGAWFNLMDRMHPELQTWLAAHPGRYLLKMTLPEGVSDVTQLSTLQDRILGMLAAQKRQDSSADLIMKLDPLVLAGAQASLPVALRQQFGPEAHLAVTADANSGSVFVMAARAGRENEIAQAVKFRMAQTASSRLSGRHPGILAMFIEDMDRTEWRSLRDSLELEGVARRFLTEPEARHVVAVTCTSRAELFGLPAPDSAPDGELRFRNPGHPAAKNPHLAPGIASSV
jgi:hypothetical protein